MTFWDKVLLVSGVCIGYGIILGVLAALSYGFARLWVMTDRKK